MSEILWKTLRLVPAALGASLLVASSSLAAQKPVQTVTDQAVAATNLPADGIESAEESTSVPETAVQEIAANTDASTPIIKTPVAIQENATNQEVAADSLKDSTTLKVAQTEVPSSETAKETTEVLQELNQYSDEVNADESMDQVTNVSQLSDVQPTDWAYEALQSLVERYGCIAGYPNGTFRGNRALSRYEFAAGLNACLAQVEKLIDASSGGFVTKEDLATLQRLIDEFGAELATLRGRVDTLEGRVTTLEENQFSTTTKLLGEVIFAVADVFGDETAIASGSTAVPRDLDDNGNTIFADRARLNLDTSFTGKDRLRTRLQARNITSFGSAVTGTNMTRLGFDGDEGNDIALSKLEYRFPLTSKATIYLSATGGEYNDNVENFNGLLAGSADGAISRFGRFNPIYRQASEGAGVTINYNFSKALGLSLGYQALPNVANNPFEGFGLFDGGYAALAQLAFKPSDALSVGLTYVHSYNNNESGVSVSGGTGSGFANNPFGNRANGRGTATSANHFGLEANFRLSPRIVLGGWAGYTQAIAEGGTGLALVNTGDKADIFNAAVTLAFPDLGQKGNLLGFVFGVPPKVTNNDYGTGSAREDDDTSLHLEGFYRYQLSSNISITPGLVVIFNPEHNSSNDTIYVGTLRTTFKF